MIKIKEKQEDRYMTVSINEPMADQAKFLTEAFEETVNSNDKAERPKASISKAQQLIERARVAGLAMSD